MAAARSSSVVTPVIPGRPRPSSDGGRRGTLPGATHVPNASRARTTSLVHGVIAFDVTPRVGLGEPAGLGCGERLAVAAAVTAHRAEDVVRGAIHDAPDAIDPVAGEIRSERPEDGQSAANGCLESQGGASRAGRRLEIRAVMGEHVLVGRHDGLAGREGGRDERPGRLVATDQLDDDVHVGRGDEVRRRVGQQVLRNPGRGVSVHVADGDPRELERPAVAGRSRQSFRRLKQGTDDLAADAPGAEHADAKGRAVGDGRLPGQHRPKW